MLSFPRILNSVCLGEKRATKREVAKTILGEDLQPSALFLSMALLKVPICFTSEAKKRRLTPEQLALGEQLIYSSKSAREVEEWGWNR